MTDDDKPKTIRLDVRDIAAIAVQVLDRADDGQKLLSVTNNYPKGAKAFEYGFLLTCGGLAAIGVALTIGRVLTWMF